MHACKCDKLLSSFSLTLTLMSLLLPFFPSFLPTVKYSRSWALSVSGSSVDSGFAWNGLGLQDDHHLQNHHSSRTTTPSPPFSLSAVAHNLTIKTANERTSTSSPSSNNSNDEGIELDESTVCNFVTAINENNAHSISISASASASARAKNNKKNKIKSKKKSRTRPVSIFQCNWPGCRQQYDLCEDIERHVRCLHLR